jgi:hypothetical protein
LKLEDMTIEQINAYLELRAKAAAKADDVFIVRMTNMCLTHAGLDSYRAASLAYRISATILFGRPGDES